MVPKRPLVRQASKAPPRPFSSSSTSFFVFFFFFLECVYVLMCLNSEKESTTLLGVCFTIDEIIVHCTFLWKVFSQSTLITNYVDVNIMFTCSVHILVTDKHISICKSLIGKVKKDYRINTDANEIHCCYILVLSLSEVWNPCRSC